MGEPTWDDDDQRWADVAHIAAAVKRYMKNQAYLLTGGSNGCALCADRTLEESLAAGHRDCGVTKIRWDAAHELFATACDFDLSITIARAIDDPRLFQWTAPSAKGNES